MVMDLPREANRTSDTHLYFAAVVTSNTGSPIPTELEMFSEISAMKSQELSPPQTPQSSTTA